MLEDLYGPGLGGLNLQEEMEKVSGGGEYKEKVTKELFGPYAYQFCKFDDRHCLVL